MPPILPAVAMMVSASLLSSGEARAATIDWGPAVNVSTGIGNSSDVSTNGTLVEAFNAAATSSPSGNQTVNGVSFVRTTNLLGSDVSITIDFSDATDSGDASYDIILSTLDYGGGPSTTITLGDGDGNSATSGTGLLQIGGLYEIQVWFVDDRTAPPNAQNFDARVMGFASSSSDTVANVNDQYVIGTFTADASTQTLFLDTVSSAPGDGFGNTHITAYQIRAIPEPASCVLAAMGELFVLRRRR